MKKSIVMAFALGVLSMLSFNLFASDSGDIEVRTPATQNIEVRNEDKNINSDTNINNYNEGRNNCYNNYRDSNTQRGTGRGCY